MILTKIIKKYPYTISLLPSNLRTVETYKRLCYDIPECFEMIPQEIKTYDFCLEMIKKHHWLIIHIPVSYRTYELCQYAIKHIKMLKHVPIQHRDKAMCMNALKIDPSSLCKVPKNIIDMQLIETALKSCQDYEYKDVISVLTDDLAHLMAKKQNKSFNEIWKLFTNQVSSIPNYDQYLPSKYRGLYNKHISVTV